MSDPADAFDLRRLVERAVALETPSSSRKSHPLGLGLPRRKTYAHPEGAIPLPTYEPGLINLRRTTSEPPPLPLLADMPTESWSAILKSPECVIPLRAPSADELLERGIAVPSEAEAAQRLRQVGLAVVVRSSQETLDDGYLSAGRAAAVGRLTVVLSERTKSSADDAWLESEWTLSASRFMSLLEGLWPDALPPAQRRSDLSSTLLVSQEWDEVVTSTMVERLTAVSGVCGSAMTPIRLATTQYSDVRRSLKARSPRVLIAIGSHGDGALRGLLAEHKDANPSGWSTIVGRRDSEGLVEAIREAFIQFLNVAAGLHAVGPPPRSDRGARPKLPVRAPGRCLHDASETAYVEDCADGLWWSRDWAGHGGSVFKTYRMIGDKLEHEACRSADGAPIDKWKGPIGLTVPMKSLHGCRNGPCLK